MTTMKTILQTTVLSLVVITMSTAVLLAQDGPPTNDELDDRRANQRPNVLRQLGLNRQQLQQIRQYNMKRRPMMENAQVQFREANRRLDEAIYADELNEAEVQARVKDVQLAQAELIKLRSMNELSIRKILTPDQLTKFRRMRQRFEEARRADRQALRKQNRRNP